MTAKDARASAILIKRRIETVVSAIKRDPSLVRIANGGNGDRIAIWFERGRQQSYNLDEGLRQIASLQKEFGQAILSRAGREFKLDLPELK